MDTQGAAASDYTEPAGLLPPLMHSRGDVIFMAYLQPLSRCYSEDGITKWHSNYKLCYLDGSQLN